MRGNVPQTEAILGIHAMMHQELTSYPLELSTSFAIGYYRCRAPKALGGHCELLSELETTERQETS